MRTWMVKFCICLGVLMTVCEAMPNQMFARTRRGRLCGSQLAEALAMVCYSYYYAPREQRSQSFPTVFQETMWHQQPEHKKFEKIIHSITEQSRRSGSHYSLQPLIEKQEYERRGREVRNPSSGIVDECCRKSCSYDELLAYCGGPDYSDDGHESSQA